MFEEAVKQAIKAEIERAVKIETEKAKAELDARIPQIVAGLTIKVLSDGKCMLAIIKKALQAYNGGSFMKPNESTPVYVCLLGSEFLAESCAQWRTGSFCANTGGECKHRGKPVEIPADKPEPPAIPRPSPSPAISKVPPEPQTDKKADQPVASQPNPSYPMTNAELTDAIMRLGNLPASSGFCSGSVEKEIADQIKFLLKVQRRRVLKQREQI